MGYNIGLCIICDGVSSGALDYLKRKNLIPNIGRMMDQGSSTLDCRTDDKLTLTLPNITGMFVSTSSSAHGTNFNHLGHNQHTPKKSGSLFDRLMVGQTGNAAMYVEKTKLVHIERVYEPFGTDGIKFCYQPVNINITNDLIPQSVCYQLLRDLQFGLGWIDQNMLDPNAELVRLSAYHGDARTRLFAEMGKTEEPRLYQFNVIHFRAADSTGHMVGWNTHQYYQAIIHIDQQIGHILRFIDKYEKKDGTYRFGLALTADHGGGYPDNSNTNNGTTSTLNHLPKGNNHGDSTSPHNFTIPMVLWGTQIRFRSTDLYEHSRAVLWEFANTDQFKKRFHGMVPVMLQRIMDQSPTVPNRDLNPPVGKKHPPIRNLSIGNLFAGFFGKVLLSNSSVNIIHLSERIEDAIPATSFDLPTIRE